MAGSVQQKVLSTCYMEVTELGTGYIILPFFFFCKDCVMNVNQAYLAMCAGFKNFFW
jgi:hypothetical protein